MSKRPVRVIIGREVRLTVPRMMGRLFDFKPGHSFVTQEWFYPGEPDEKGVSTNTTRDEWRFGTNMGTDLPLFFNAEDIREVTIPSDPETIQAFEGAPFNVIIHDQKH